MYKRQLYGIRGLIDNLTSRRVWLDCGGNIIIEQLETLTFIDVNLSLIHIFCPLSARVVVHQVSMKMDNERITKLISDLKTVIK